jgi:1,4-dihydroxy-2-naphthoate octaprenyltransferase
LWIAAVPVIVAGALAWSDGRPPDVLLALLTLAGSALMQVITNLQNDVGYTVRRAETGGRVGLPRATSNGWLSVRAVRRAIVAAAALTVLVGLPLVLHSGLPVLLLGLSSMAAALAYMGGRWPIAYTPLGEAVVFLFFGPAAVAGSYFVFAGAVTPLVVAASAVVGAHAAAVLAVNNHRDAEHDVRTGRRTFAAVYGAAAGRRMYGALVLSPFALCIGMAMFSGRPLLLLPLLALPWALRLRARIGTARGGEALTEVLFDTVRLEVVSGLLIAIGAVVGRAMA